MLETTTVGSLPKPEYLAETEKLWPAWRLSGEALEQAKKRAAMVYVDAERLYPCTNCGMAPIPYDMALAKIHSLAAGANLVRKTL